MYNIGNKEIQYRSAASTTSKTFVIDHPTDNNKYLVHACLEGPESGVYYRGKGEITNGNYTVVYLPPYVQHLAHDFTIQITHIYDGSNKSYSTSEIGPNSFIVYGENGRFFWLVHGTRSELNVEPLKKDTDVKGDGPYKWI